MIRRIWMACISFALLGASAFAQQTPPQSPDGFVPLSSLPPGEEMPGAPFLIAAYGFFILLMLFYLWTIWNRLARVEKEMHELERRQGGAPR
jgi:hypothetical protein